MEKPWRYFILVSDHFRLPPGPAGDDRLTDFSNGHDSNYYDRFYKKTPSAEPKTDSQSFLQSEPLYF